MSYKFYQILSTSKSFVRTQFEFNIDQTSREFLSTTRIFIITNGINLSVNL